MSDEENPKNNIIKFPGSSSEDHIVEELESVVALPSVVDPKANHDDLRNRIDYVKNQDLVTALHRGASVGDLEDLVMKEIAEEIAHQKYERRIAARNGKVTTNHSVARIASLRSLVDILNRKRALDKSDKLDLSSPRFQVILKIWMDFVYESMVKCNIPEETIDLVFGQMKADMIEWEKLVINADAKQSK